MNSYVPLHVHTDRDSVLDSMVKATKVSRTENSLIVQKAYKYDMPALAITGHGYMSGIIEHYKNCKEAGIKPIVGMEAYVTDDYTIKDSSSKYYHLILLAKNNEGYRNIKILSSIGCIDGFYRKPRIDFATLKKYHKGIIVLSACLGSELDKMIMREDYNEEDAYALIEKYQDIFGNDYYIEIQSSDSPDQIKVNKELVRLAKEMETDVVVTTDVHFLNKDDFNAHNVYININQDRDTENYKYCWLQTREEIEEILIPQLGTDTVRQVLDNTYKVAEKCNVEIELGNPYLPHLKIPEQYKDEYEWLLGEIDNGIKLRKIDKKPNLQEYLDRIKFELNVIHTKGFDGYFLILMEIIRKAKERGIPIGEGRGSAGGSIVAYCLNITNVDSVEYDLDFGRFLTMERKDLPDIDTDVSTSRRGELIDIITEMFGVDNVAQVATFGTLASKAVIDAVGKVMEIPRELRDDFKAKITDGKGVKSIIENDNKSYVKYRDYFDTCIKIEGANRSYGCHAGAVCISGNNKPMVDYAPVMYTTD